ncbi:MAG: glycosyltransferase, partial [Candidatus Acidiferrales bacterium]
MPVSRKLSLQNTATSLAAPDSTEPLAPVAVSHKYRVLLVASHPVQYASPLFRLLAEDPRLEIQVAYCSLQGAEPGKDPEFGMDIMWDIPLLDGYPWQQIPNRSPRPGLGRFFGLINTGLWKLVRSGKFDAVIVYGYAYLSYWIAFLAAKVSGIPILLPTDSVRLQNYRGGWWWKRLLKPPAIRFIYKRLASAIMAPSTATQRFLGSLGISKNRIYLTNYVVDNDLFRKAAGQIDPFGIRKNWKVPAEAFVVLFCAKLVPWKRPEDLLTAFASVCRQNNGASGSAFLVFAGDG